MENSDILAAVGAVVLSFVVLAGFDIVRSQPIAWLFDGGLAVVIGVFVLYLRTTIEPED